MFEALQPQPTISLAKAPIQRKGPDCDFHDGDQASVGKCRGCGGAIQRKSQPQGLGSMGNLLFGSEARSQSIGSKLPSGLQNQLETTSGLGLDDVRVFRNSSEPARIGAWAFTQGRDIHLGPGQEKHLAHESWHAVQQKQGRVKATTSLFGMPVNDQSNLETEADLMGASTATGPHAMTDHVTSTSQGEGIVQGVFMDDNHRDYSKRGLVRAVNDYALDDDQEEELLARQAWDRQLFLSTWLRKEGFLSSLPSRKRERSRSSSDSDSSDDTLIIPPTAKPKRRILKRRRKLAKPVLEVESSSDEDEIPRLRMKTKPKPRARSRSRTTSYPRIFSNNLGFGPTVALDKSKRQYFPTPLLDFAPLFFDAASVIKKEDMQVPLDTTMKGLKTKAPTPGFRGNLVKAKFKLIYIEDGQTKVSKKGLTMPDVPNTFHSAHELSRSRTLEVLSGITALQTQIGVTTRGKEGNIVHSERTMVLALDDLQIDDKLVTAIKRFAKGRNLNLLSAVLIIYSSPNEVCGNCDTALRALTQATKIEAMRHRLIRSDIRVDPGFGLRIITGAGQLDSARKFRDPFRGKPSGMPTVMHTFQKPEL